MRCTRKYSKVMEKDAEAFHPNHVPECGPRILRHAERRRQRGKSPNQGDSAQRSMTVVFVEQRVHDHNQHSEKRKHQLWQDAHVVGALRQHGSLHLRQQAGQ
jgi:hypothetical protein